MFSLKGREMHEFVVLNIPRKRLNAIKASLDFEKGVELVYEVSNEIPPFNLPNLYIIEGTNIIILSIISGQVVNKFDYAEIITANVKKNFLFDLIQR